MCRCVVFTYLDVMIEKRCVDKYKVKCINKYVLHIYTYFHNTILYKNTIPFFLSKMSSCMSMYF